jgi:uncharacterized coiled-coil DUF342 family protein
MDKKSKKKLDLINQRLQLLRRQFAGANKQNDTPGEVERLTREIATLEAEVKQLKEA